MKSIFFYAVFLSYCNSFAQFAIIKDSDGYTNIRSEAQKGNNIIDKLENGFVVYSFQPDNNWVNIDYSKNNKDKNGYLYKDRIKYLSEFEKISLTQETQSKVIFKKDGLRIILESKKFDRKNVKLTFLNEDKSLLDKINGKQFWGTDGEIPKNTYKEITLFIENKTIALPKKSFEDLFEPSLFDTHVYFDKKSDIIYITSSNSDGAGGYEIVWIIEKGQYKERKIAYNF